jgi:hypothetical protein
MSNAGHICSSNLYHRPNGEPCLATCMRPGEVRHRGWSLRANEPTPQLGEKNLRMGTPHNSLHGTHQGLGTPSFPTHPSMTGNGSSTTVGAGTGEPQQRLRVYASFHRFRSPFLERHGGVLAGRSVSVTDEKPRGSRQSAGHPGASLGRESGRTCESAPGHDIIRHGDDSGRGSRHVAPVRRWLR